MPNISRQLRAQLGLDGIRYSYVPNLIFFILSGGHKIGEPSSLFVKMEDSLVLSLRKKNAGKQNSNGKEKNKNVDVIGDVGTLEGVLQSGLCWSEIKAKQDKSVWQPEVQILLKFKK